MNMDIKKIQITERQFNTIKGYLNESETGIIYKELEFLCQNSSFDDATPNEVQEKFFIELQRLGKETNSIYAYRQDFSDEEHTEISMAVIILDKKNEKQLENYILNLAKKFQIEFDLYGERTESQVNGIINGTYYDNLI